MAKRAIGRPFAPGQSGNPDGRPRVVADVRERARVLGPEMIEELARLAFHAESDTVRVAAIRELLDRGYGKPAQAFVGEGGDGPIVVSIKKGLGDARLLSEAAP